MTRLGRFVVVPIVSCLMTMVFTISQVKSRRKERHSEVLLLLLLQLLTVTVKGRGVMMNDDGDGVNDVSFVFFFLSLFGFLLVKCRDKAFYRVN